MKFETTFCIAKVWYDNLFPAKILFISNYSNIVTSAVQYTDKMAENRSKSQEAATLLRRAASMLT
jgi:hypothetical protein